MKSLIALMLVSLVLLAGCVQTPSVTTPTPPAPSAAVTVSPTPNVPGFDVGIGICVYDEEGAFFSFTDSTHFTIKLVRRGNWCGAEISVDSVESDGNQMVINLKKTVDIEAACPACAGNSNVVINGVLDKPVESIVVNLDGEQTASFFLTGSPSPEVSVFGVDLIPNTCKSIVAPSLCFSNSADFRISLPARECNTFFVESVQEDVEEIEIPPYGTVPVRVKKIALKTAGLPEPCFSVITCAGDPAIVVTGTFPDFVKEGLGAVYAFKVFLDGEEIASFPAYGLPCGEANNGCACPGDFECNENNKYPDPSRPMINECVGAGGSRQI